MMILDMATGEVERPIERREPLTIGRDEYRAPEPVAALQEMAVSEAETRQPDAGVLAGLDIAAFVDAQR